MGVVGQSNGRIIRKAVLATAYARASVCSCVELVVLVRWYRARPAVCLQARARKTVAAAKSEQTAEDTITCTKHHVSTHVWRPCLTVRLLLVGIRRERGRTWDRPGSSTGPSCPPVTREGGREGRRECDIRNTRGHALQRMHGAAGQGSG